MVEGPLGSTTIYALLDEGSTVTLVHARVARLLGCLGLKEPLVLQGIGSSSMSDRCSQKIQLKIKGIGATHLHNLCNVRTVEGLSLPCQTVKAKELEIWPHLNSIPFSGYENATPEILIGQDHWELAISLRVVRAGPSAPVASLTELGWVIHGKVSAVSEVKDYVSLTTCDPAASERSREFDELHELMKSYFRLESVGISSISRVNRNEERAQHILESSTVRIDGRWQTSLLWKEDKPSFPDNYDNALKRLMTVEKKLDKNPELKRAYTEQVNNLLQQGYASPVSESTPRTAKTWFLPHFGVTNPNKPGKLRLVFDAAARTRGVCLNDKLLSGPDLWQSLPGVLMRFRQRSIALKGDIKEMFLQVKISAEDQHAQQFLWCGENRNRNPDTYKMTSLIFGATSSPCTALYVKNRNAAEFHESHTRASRAIVRNHYMDDYLDSADSESEAERLISEVTYIHRQGGFEIRSWASNRPHILRELPKESLAERDVDLSLKSEHSQMTLGLRWSTDTDVLYFNTGVLKSQPQLIDAERIPVKREILRIIMSVFDPLGFLLPFTTKSKILMQEVWRRGTGWDEQLCNPEVIKWRNWVKELPSVLQCKIPRCYVRSADVRVELHVFCDASEQAYAAVAYWLFLLPDGRKSLAFASGKSRVALLKLMSIPRLELQAALLGSRLSKTVQDEHNYTVLRKTLWTDSQTVLRWIQNDPRSYKAFVAHRLGEIDELTNTSEWRWVPSIENPADDATCDNGGRINPEMRWLNGPGFLLKPECDWPKLASLPEKDSNNEEVRNYTLAITPKVWSLPDVNRFSKWYRLIRTTAWIIYVSDLPRSKNLPRNGIDRDHIIKAERLWIRKSQEKSYFDEITALENGRMIDRKSKLNELSPQLNEHGLLVVASRIRAAEDIPENMKFPVILDGSSRYTRLLVHHYHEKACHGSTEMVLNKIRQEYWITRLRPTLRLVASRCQECRIRKARVVVPREGDLPLSRVAHHQRPFSHCGVDYFGPMNVTIGRRQEKRWGVIFTCMTSRAVHLELAATMTTDSMILALRRMAAEKGHPTDLYSDNGANFRGAEAELRAAVQALDQSKINEFSANLKVKWHFIPPLAPHMGGCWERLIQCVKTSLRVTLKERAPREEVLLTLLKEAADIINNRPLTHVSLDHRDGEALTPNHLLRGASPRLYNPGVFTEDDIYSRRQWRVAQRLVDMFWSRWVREYLPTLIPRKKWLSDSPDIKLDDVVIVCDHTLPRNAWPKGTVVGLFPGQDGRVRVADVKTTKGVFRRPLAKLVRLTTEKSATS